MRVAVVNNATIEPKRILSLLKEDEEEVFDYSQSKNIFREKFDLLILSGSSQFPIEYNKDKLADEIELIQKSSTPILGICYGCELIAVAFGGTLADRGEGSQLRENVCVKTEIADSLFIGREEFLVYDAHRWSIDVVPESLSVLASSEHGPEVIKHKTRPVYGFQFHPEKMLDETFGDELFNSFLKIEIGAR